MRIPCVDWLGSEHVMFAILFPETLRRVFLAVLGWQLLTIVLVYYSSWHRLDVLGLLSPGHYHQSALSPAVSAAKGVSLLDESQSLCYRLWLVYGACFISHVLLFPYSLHHWLSLMGWLGIVVVVLYSLVTGSIMTSRWAASLGRTVDPFRWSQSTAMVDVLTGDILTSYSRLLADLLVMMVMIVTKGKTYHLDAPLMNFSLIPVMAMGFPYFCRLRQCIADFRVDCGGRQRQHLMNALKYASAFPGIFLGNAHRHSIRLFWFSVVYTIASSTWDLWMDWDFRRVIQKTPKSESASSDGRFFSIPTYTMASIINCGIRASWWWSWKWPQFWSSLDGIFLLQLLEILRRFMWLVFRLETHMHHSSSLPRYEGIMFDQFVALKPML